MLDHITMLRQLRTISLNVVDDLSEDQLLYIPEGLKNNILWNFGHMIASHQGICYRAQKLEGYVSKDFMGNFKNGSSPADWSDTPDIDQVKELALGLVDLYQEDIKAGIFDTYTSWQIMGHDINSREQADNFNIFHEGLHYGVILTMRKLL